MYRSGKFFIVFSIIVFCAIGKAGLLNAAWWQPDAIPVPSETQETKKEERLLQGSNLDFLYYTSSLSAGQIKDFYRQQLFSRGWKEKDLLKEINHTPSQAQQFSSSLGKALEYNIIFEKDNENIIVNFIPANYSQNGKTRYVLCKGKMQPQSDVALSGKDFIPKLTAKPKKEVVPVYPGASLTNLSEGQHDLRATYLSNDDLGEVQLFYKEKMPALGWHLTKEQLPKKVEYSGFNLADYCPSCAKNNNVPTGPMEMWTGDLGFSNQRGDSLKIILSYVSSGAQEPHSTNMTTIMVNYDEKIN